jgi:hypothetical protein
MNSHDSGTSGQPRPDDGSTTPDGQTQQWNAPAGPPVSALPPIGAVPGYAPPPVQEPGRRNWLLPLVGVLGMVLLVAVGVFIFLNMQSSPANDPARAGYAYLPDRSLMAMELRLDFPADQRDQFLTFVSRFPGFTDAASVEQRMQELLNEAIASATSGMATYQDDVEPWFAGWIVAGGDLPTNPLMAEAPSFVAAIGSNDRAAAELAMERFRGADSWTSQAGPGGTTIWVGSARFDGSSSSYAVTDDAIVVGMNAADVRRALETGSGNSPSLLEVSSFAAALARQPAGRMAMFWVDAEAMADFAEGAMPGGGMDDPFAFTCDAFPSPRSIASSLYMRDGRAYIDVTVEMPEDAAQPQMRDSGLAQRMPANTFLFMDSREVGSTVSDLLDCLRDNPLMAGQLEEIEDGIGQPIDQLIGWAGDAALGVRYDGVRASGGLVIQVTDQPRAAEAMGQLRALITASAGSMGEVTVRDEDYNGARMVTFEIGETGTELAPPPAPSASLAYAFAGDLLIIGVDASFTRAVIDTQAENSLNANPTYRRAIDAAGGSSNGGVMYLDFATTMALVEAGMGAVDGPGGGMIDDQMRDVREFMAALESMAVVSVVDGQASITRIVLSTREQP